MLLADLGSRMRAVSAFFYNRPRWAAALPAFTASPNSGYSCREGRESSGPRSEEHTSELQSHLNLVCRLLLEKKKNIINLDYILLIGSSIMNPNLPLVSLLAHSFIS